jgi:hypothetical protein
LFAKSIGYDFEFADSLLAPLQGKISDDQGAWAAEQGTGAAGL